MSFVGNTPMIEIKTDNWQNEQLNTRVFAKLEYLNPSGSIKDRAVKYMIEHAKNNGFLDSKKIVEVTSGNMGISLAMICASKGYEFTAIIPDTASKERVALIKHLGAKVVIVKAGDGYAQARVTAHDIAQKTGAWFVDQYANEQNALAHEKTTAQEIIKQVPHIDSFVAGIGTAGTLIGVAKAIRKKNPNVRIIGVEPEEGPLITKGTWNRHCIQGIGVGFIPEIYTKNADLVDEIITVSTKQSIECAKQMAKQQGLMAGVSSGANIYVAKKIAQKMNKGIVVSILADSADRYYSTALFE